MTLAAGAKLDEVNRLARVEVEHETDPVGERDRVGSLLNEPLRTKTIPLDAAPLEAFAVPVGEARLLDLLRHVRAELAAETLPLAGEHAMTLKIAKRAVVGDDLEPVADGFEPATGLVAPVSSLA